MSRLMSIPSVETGVLLVCVACEEADRLRGVQVDVHEDCQGALYLEAFVRKNLELV